MSEERNIRFRYIFSENYSPSYCNGAFGGISTRGEIVVNFFHERMPIPYHTTHTVSESGILSGVNETNPEDLNDIVIRHITNGIVLNEESARSIHEWLGEQIKELEKRKSNE